MIMFTSIPSIALAGLVLLSSGCTREKRTEKPQDQALPPTNRIAVPESVRRNLGIEFVKVERRRVAATLRAPGSFELLPAARREYRTPLAGRVEILVSPLQHVKAGDLLYRLDSPTWRAMQRDLGELSTTAKITRSRLESMQQLVEAHRGHEESLVAAAKVMTDRVQRLLQTRAEVGGQAAELSAAEVQAAQMRADQAEAREQRAEAEATLAELRANLTATEERFQLALSGAATTLGLDAARLLETPSNEGTSLPVWRTLALVETRAVAEGTISVLPVATGGWIDIGSLVLASVDVRQVHFRARGLQSDLMRLRPDLPARVVPPEGGIAIGQGVAGALALGVEADPQQRTIDLFLLPSSVPEWARAGVSAFLEIETEAGGEGELAVPLSCVLTDGLQRVLFRRDPKDPDQVLRIEADLGTDDGHWVEVRSGLADGDEVVLAGAYELMLASSGQAAKGGHFHSDGTFHPGEHK